MNLHHIYDIVGGVVMVSSLLYSFLPNWDQFTDYPTFQKWYKFVMIFLIKFGSFNYRNQVYPSIKTTDSK